MPTADKKDVARVFEEIAQLLHLKNENPFKIRAYENAARRVGDLPDELPVMIKDGRLQRVPGIGEALYDKIVELVDTGKLEFHERLKAEFPAGLLDLLKIPDIGPKRVGQLYKDLGIGSLEALRQACETHLVRGLKGFGEKLEEKILLGIARLTVRSERRSLGDVRTRALELAAAVRAAAGVTRAEVAGSVRRWKETVNDVDIIATGSDPIPPMDVLAHHPSVDQLLGRGDTKCSVVLKDGLQVDLRVLKPEQFATALHHFTGSKDHNVRLRGRAVDRQLHISEYAVTGPEGPLNIRAEEDLYKALGMSYVPPELREDRGEVEAAIAGRLPDLVEVSDLRGMVHAHTNYSDGRNSIEEMAVAAAKAGAQYLAITDNSASATYANGLTVDRLRRQWDEIDAVQARVKGVRLLKGAEVDILEDGKLDFPDAVLEKLDVVLVAVHSSFDMDEERMTRRIMTAFDHPAASVWAHPVGRILGRKPPHALNVERVLDHAAKRGVAIEVNGNPHRLDAPPEVLRLARQRSLRFVLSADAHDAGGFAQVEWAAATARRGWVEKHETLNVLPADGFLSSLRRAP